MKRLKYIRKQENQFDRFAWITIKVFSWFMLFQIIRAIAEGNFVG